MILGIRSGIRPRRAWQMAYALGLLSLIQASPVGCMCVAAFLHRMWAVELNLSLTVCVGRSAERLGHNRTRLMYIVSVARSSLGFRV